MWNKIKGIGILLLVIGLSMVGGFRFKLFTDAKKQAVMKDNFLKLCSIYQEAADWNESTDVIADMENYTPLTGETIALIQIPDIDIDVSVVEGVEKDDIALAVGHFPQTDMPWVKGGNFAVAGHSSISHSFLFNNLHEAKEGMEVKVVTKYGNYYYKITNIEVVEASRVDILERPKDGNSVITMSTCINSGKKRLIVTAVMED